MKIINPASGGIITEVEQDSKETLRSKFELLRAGQERWRSIPLEARVSVMRRFSDLLGDRIEQNAATLTSEVGKPLQQSRNEINGARTRIKWMTDNAAKYLSDEVMTNADGMEERISYEPLGVICNISAWNYPYLVGVNVFVPALMAGDAVMYKPSEHATLTGMAIRDLLYEAGVPRDAFQLAIGAREVGESLLDLPFDGYFFTGSYKTGKYIYERVASRMVPCQCELGGKDGLYVCDDVADVAAVAASTADGAFYNNGQSCCAVERIYVHEKIYDQYIDEFVREVRRWKTGNPLEDGVYIGPLARKEQLTLLEGQVRDAVAAGATLLTGGKRAEGPGFYFQPTVVANVTHQMALMRDESFGPVIGIMKVEDDEEAVNLINDSEYGLTASVYSANESRAKSILSRLNAGTGYWNCCDRVSAALPWSGRKHSGIGATLSHAGLRAFTHPKAYHLRRP